MELPKLDPKGKEGVSLDYEPHAKVYRMLEHGKVIISKDVVVDHCSPFLRTNIKSLI
jgi:hypothetical protein